MSAALLGPSGSDVGRTSTQFVDGTLAGACWASGTKGRVAVLAR